MTRQAVRQASLLGDTPYGQHALEQPVAELRNNAVTAVVAPARRHRLGNADVRCSPSSAEVVFDVHGCLQQQR